MARDNFLSGVVEGFYGRPWKQRQRIHLLEQLAELGLNAYFYAPKNDLKHRSIWREPYDDAELAAFRDLIQVCDRLGIHFVYGLSPGLDMKFAAAEERNRIAARLEQMRLVGAAHFALLFDDLPGNLTDDDRQAFPSLAAAHSDVANTIFEFLRARDAGARLLFCPTPYCDRMDRAHHGGAGYLDEIGRLLTPGVDVLWTGPEIVSEEISVPSIERLALRLRRRPIIWDNLFANDYDSRRHFCGPFAGRPRELRNAVGGFFINPNNEYPLNFIPLQTFAAFLNGDGEWRQRDEFLSAAKTWLPHFETVTRSLSLDDLILLADCFYLPHSFGPNGVRLVALVEQLIAEPVEACGGAHEEFVTLNGRVQAATEGLTELRNRELFEAWSRRAWELRNELQVIDAVLAHKAAGRDIDAGIEVDHCLPGTFHGGMLANLERFLTIDREGTLRPYVNTRRGNEL